MYPLSEVTPERVLAAAALAEHLRSAALAPEAGARDAWRVARVTARWVRLADVLFGERPARTRTPSERERDEAGIATLAWTYAETETAKAAVALLADARFQRVPGKGKSWVARETPWWLTRP